MTELCTCGHTKDYHIGYQDLKNQNVCTYFNGANYCPCKKFSPVKAPWYMDEDGIPHEIEPQKDSLKEATELMKWKDDNMSELIKPQNQSQAKLQNKANSEHEQSPDARKGLFDTTDLEKEIRDQLEKGITRNKVLPLDWAMDRIKPLLENDRQRLKAEVEKVLDDLDKQYSTDEEFSLNFVEELKKRLLG